MNILMLGNGFDLYHKLPTTYLCFLQTAELIGKKEALPENIAYVFEELKDSSKEIDRSYSSYKEFYEKYFFNETEKEQLLELVTIARNNIWFNYFLNVYNKDAGWIDFEREISFVLRKISNVFTFRELYNKTLGNVYCRCNICDEYIMKYFNFYMKETNDYSCFVIEDEYTKETQYGSNLYSIDKEKIYSHLFNELKQLAKALKIYLKVFVENPLVEMEKRKIVKTNDLFKKFDIIISFNYTNTYNTLYGEANMYCIHGTLKDDIVLGIFPDEKDELLDLDTSYIMFKKYYQRVLYRTDTSFIKIIGEIKEKRKAFNSSDAILTVCGHSLDETDKDIIKDAFDVSEKIYIVCHDLSEIGKYVSRLIKIYGKNEFDRIRSDKDLKFISYDEWKKVNYSKHLQQPVYVKF